MGDPKPTRTQGDLAEMLDTLLDKGVVVNADIAVTVGDTELLGIRLRAAVASFETAAEYGLAFPSGTDMDRVRAASGVDPVSGPERGLDLDAAEGGERLATGTDPDGRPAAEERPTPSTTGEDDASGTDPTRPTDPGGETGPDTDD